MKLLTAPGRLNLRLLILTLLITGISISCKNKKDSSVQGIKEIAPEFTEYVTAITSGVISSESSVKVILSSNSERLNENEGAIEDKLFRFEPKIEGTTRWLDYRTIEFIPNEKLTSATLYEASLDLSKVIEVPSEFKILDFNFKTIQQNFSVSQEGLNLYPNLKNQYFLKG
ncbi:MAG: hypothetical protein MI922_16750, partial [Bacteroidales bacterium]|nr:hypothetical protein [Bacteroidales bacterium]